MLKVMLIFNLNTQSTGEGVPGPQLTMKLPGRVHSQPPLEVQPSPLDPLTEQQMVESANLDLQIDCIKNSLFDSGMGHLVLEWQKDALKQLKSRSLTS